jgi:tol-pal system protein YbgF
MTSKSSVAVAALALVMAVAGARPASARDKEIQQLAADIRMLQEQSQQLQNLLAQFGDALKAVNQRLNDQGEVNVKAFADQKLIIDRVSTDLGVVREKLDDTNTRVGSISQEVDALRQALQQQAAAAARQSAVEPADGGGVPGASSFTTGAPAQPAALALGVSPQRMFDTAKGDYAAGLWDLAITGFRGYIASVPKSDMADDAQVFIGNSYLQDGKNDKAIEAYDIAIRTYPNGNAIPEAYYKKGLAHRNLRQTDQARQAFETLIRLFPQSDAAGLARQGLIQLGGASPR